MMAFTTEDLQSGAGVDEVEDPRIRAALYDLVKEGEAKLSYFRDEYTRTFRYYRNADDVESLDKPSGAKWYSEAKMNIVRDWTDKMVGSANASKPIINVTAGSYDDEPLAYLMNACIENVWRYNHMSDHTISASRNTLVGGCCALYAGWNPKLRDGRGEIEGRMVDGRDMVWDRSGRCIENATWIAERSYPTRMELIARFPWHREAIMKLPAHEIAEPRSGGARPSPVVRPAWSEASAGAGYTPGHKEHGWVPNIPGGDPRGISERLEAYDLWMRPVQNEDMAPSYGRRVCFVKDLILDDGHNPYWCRDRIPWPYIFMRMEEIPGELAPKGRMQHLVPLQRQINEILRGLANYVRVSTFLKLIYPDGMVERDDLETDAFLIKALPDLINDLKPYFLAAPQVGDAAIQIYRIYMEAAQLTLGIGDGVLGQTPGDVTAASAIKELRKIYNEGIQLFVQENLEPALRQWGELVRSHVTQFYTDERSIRVAGPAGEQMLQQLSPEWQEIIAASQGDTPVDQVRFPAQWFAKIPAFDRDIPGTMGRPPERRRVSIFYGAEDFDIQVKVGSGAPTDPEKAMQVGMVFAQNGWIDPRQVVERTDYRYTPPAPPQPQLPGAGGGASPPLTTEQPGTPSSTPVEGVPSPAPAQGAM